MAKVTASRIRSESPGLFYFFNKGSDYIRCEIREGDGGAWELLMTEPDGVARLVQFSTLQQANQGWEKLQARLLNDGWFGPYGRE